MSKKKISIVMSTVITGMMLLNSAFSASAAKLGDPTGDGAVNAVDASAILTDYALTSTNQPSQFTEEQTAASDVDKNGVINAVDASQVLGFYAYISTGGQLSLEEYIDGAASTAEAPYGKWSMDEMVESDFNITSEGIVLTSDGKGSVYLDTTEELRFTSKGLCVGYTIIPESYITRDGDNIVVNFMGQEALNMTKIDGNEGSDGTYKLNKCVLYNKMITALSEQGKFDEGALSITIEFSGEESEAVYNDLFTFTTEGGNISFSGFTGFLKGEGSDTSVSAAYKIDGNKLTINTDNGASSFTKV